MSGKKTDPWECRACTWVNDNEFGLACIMCQTERKLQKNLGGAAQTSAAKPFASCRKRSDMPNIASSSAVARGSGCAPIFRHKQCTGAEEPSSTQPSQGQGEKRAANSSHSESFETTAINETNKIRTAKRTTEGGNEKWDAFASLESNYQSSDDDDSDGDVDRKDGEREGSGGENGDGNGEMGNYAGRDEWDAFKSLEQNYQSSEEEYDSDGSSEGGEGSEDDMEDCGLIEGGGDGKTIGKKADRGMECVDLVESDQGSDSELDVIMPGKGNNQTGSQSPSRKRPEKYEPYVIDGDSESSLSEVESRRPLPSPSARRPPPSWQRRRSTPIRSVDNLKTSDSFSCMNGRNDVIGGSGVGVNGFQMSKRKGEDSDDTTAKRKSRKSSTSSGASSASSRKASTSTSAASKTRKRRWETTSKAGSKSASEAPAKKRRKRSYRKSNKRSGRGRGNSTGGRRASSNNAWSARERGIRQPYRRGSGESGPYMAITKQEPMLRNVGGASIQF